MPPNWTQAGAIRKIGKSVELRPWTHRSGHHYIALGRGHKFQVHTLVLLAFIGPKPANNYECCHRDGNPINNSVENLYWGTRKQNIDDLRHQLGKHPSAKLTLEQAESIRSNLTGKHGEQTRLARSLAVSVACINKIVLGKAYKW